ncbi:MAG: response regulator transcription factor [Ruminococcus sp.]|nr:response regulator transcription factor [Ruminococcus sp.]
MRLLLVEDEKRMAEALGEILRKEKYDVEIFNDGESGLLAALSDVYDIVILDVMLPKMSGFEIAKRVRKEGIKTPILMLTAKGELDDKVEGLDSGADDYLTKPFMTKELLARLRALTRRFSGETDRKLSFGDLELNTETCMLLCKTNGQSVRLKEKEFNLMRYLLSNQGHIMDRETLAVKVWSLDSEAEYNNVEVYISFTRKKLKFIGSSVKIKAVRGIGYELRNEGRDV